MALNTSVLGSGSSGNATLIWTDSTSILIDAGLGPRQVRDRMASLGRDAAGLDAVFLSHEHGDHVKGCAAISKNAGGCPVLASPWTLAADWPENVKRPASVETLHANVDVTVGDLTVTPFSVPHDAVDPMAFIVSHAGVRMAVLLDCGYMTNPIRSRLRDCAIIVIESNYDETLLRHGPYPEFVKERVGSTLGHLSNCDMASWLLHDFDGAANHILLGHLSRQNNTPSLAATAARLALRDRGLSPNVITTSQQEPTIALTA